MRKTIIAVRRDGYDFNAFAVTLEYSNPDLDINQAVRNAATEYALETKEGRELYSYNFDSLNWADFESSVPNEICEKYGFRKVSDSCPQDIVEWDEELVDEPVEEI